LKKIQFSNGERLYLRAAAEYTVLADEEMTNQFCWFCQRSSRCVPNKIALFEWLTLTWKAFSIYLLFSETIILIATTRLSINRIIHAIMVKTRRVSEYSRECDSKRIQSVTLYKPKLSLHQSSKSKRRIAAYHIVFFVAYIYQVYWVASTIGLPYQQFLEKAEREGFEGKFGA